MKQKKENNFPLMARYLKGNLLFFAAALFCSVLSSVCNSVTPQVSSVPAEICPLAAKAAPTAMTDMICRPVIKSPSAQ